MSQVTASEFWAGVVLWVMLSMLWMRIWSRKAREDGEPK